MTLTLSWGPIIWKILHGTAAHIARRSVESDANRQIALDFLQSFPHLLPCDECFRSSGPFIREIMQCERKLPLLDRYPEIFIKLHARVNRKLHRIEMPHTQDEFIRFHYLYRTPFPLEYLPTYLLLLSFNTDPVFFEHLTSENCIHLVRFLRWVRLGFEPDHDFVREIDSLMRVFETTRFRDIEHFWQVVFTSSMYKGDLSRSSEVRNYFSVTLNVT